MNKTVHLNSETLKRTISCGIDIFCAKSLSVIKLNSNSLRSLRSHPSISVHRSACCTSLLRRWLLHILFFLTFRLGPNKNFSLIGFFMLALVLILSVWIEASRRHPPCWCTLVGGKQCKGPYVYKSLACTVLILCLALRPGSCASHWESTP